jgi:putative flippase GtrA
VSTPDAAVAPPSRLTRLAQDQRVVFLVVGAVNTAFGFAVFTALQLTLGRVAHYLLVLAISHVIGVFEAFLLYRRRVFKVEGNFLIDLLRFESVNVSTLITNAVLLPLLVEVAAVPVIPAQAVVVAANAVISFFGHKHFSFRRSA